MTIYKHKNGYYGYNFMYKGQRHSHTFKGLSKVEVELKEMQHKISLRDICSVFRYSDINCNKTQHKWEEALSDFKSYAQTHYAKPKDCMHTIKIFGDMVKDMNLNDIKPRHIENYIAHRKEIVKNSTINREINTIRKIFTLAVSNDLIDKNPCKGIKYLRVEHSPERYLSKREEYRLLKHCSPMLKSIIKTALYSGMRKNEILGLKWVDINFKGKYLTVRKTKNGKKREIPICEPFMELLQSVPKSSEYVFTNPATLTRYSDIHHAFNTAVKKSRIDPITFHQLRHTTASRLNEIGVDIVTIQEILGHARITTTRIYTHNNRKDKIRAMGQLGKY